jgi:hypothetical protein
MTRRIRKEIFEGATVQCLHCGRFFIKEMPHNCSTGYRKHHHKWAKVTTNNIVNSQITGKTNFNNQ